MADQVRVLIVDDSVRSREGLRALLATSHEIEVVGEASNGQQAIQMVAEHNPDVVLMDVRMPVIDGLEATRRIKGDCPATNVIILTLYTTYQAQAAVAGAADFLIKGGPPEKLLETVKTWGSGRKPVDNPNPPLLTRTEPCHGLSTGC